MKHGKNPTRAQKVIIKSMGLLPKNWLVCKDTTNEMVIEHRISGNMRVIRKELLR